MFAASTLVVPMTVAVAFAAAAAWIDARRHRIPNRLVAVGALAALATQIALYGWSGAGAALAGFAVGLALMIPFYVIGAMGAGDAKLMAMVGAGAGPLGVLSVAVLTFLIGGALAVLLAMARGMLLPLLANVRAMLYGAFTTVVLERRAQFTAPAVPVGQLPYGVAIALGTVAYAVLTHMGVRIF